MNRTRFEAIVEAYGADAKHWPAAERAEAEALAATPEAVALLAEARRLNAVLDLAREPLAAAPALASRILNAAPRRRAPAAFDRRAAWALAACAVLAVAFGYGGGQLAPTASDPDALIVAAFEASAVDDAWFGDGG